MPIDGNIVQPGREVSQLPLPGAARVTASSNSLADCGAAAACAECGRREPVCRRGQCAAQRWTNCQCDGSYKHPVPPLSTYHWPGLYSQQRTTDYHSPWRFPPLRPFREEPDDETLAPPQDAAVDGVPARSAGCQTRRAAVATRSTFTATGLPEPASEKLLRLYGP